MTAAATLTGVVKRFGEIEALRGVDLAVQPGQVLALLGPNGAGKTTAIAVLLGLRSADAGTARIFGGDPRRTETRRSVGVTPQEMAFPLALRVREILELARQHYPSPAPLDGLVERFRLTEMADRQAGGLSGGQRRRLAVALAFAGAPPLVVLDEPTAGLDAEARGAVWDAVRTQRDAGGSVLLTTHSIEEAEALSDRVAVIDAGRIITDGPVAEVKRAAGLTRIGFRRPESPFVHPGAVVEDGRVRLLAADAGATVAQLVREGISLVDLEVRPASLQEALDALREKQ